MLMATLREGAPAPAPSKVMVASAKPFIPNARRRQAMRRRPAERHVHARRSASTRAAGPSAATEANSSDRTRRNQRCSPPTLRRRREGRTSRSGPAPAAGFAPSAAKDALGLMSGRGLY